MMTCVYGDCAANVKELLECNASPFITNEVGHSPLMLAHVHGKKKIRDVKFRFPTPSLFHSGLDPEENFT